MLKEIVMFLGFV